MSSAEFAAIAERAFELRGPAERLVCARIGAPEPHPEHASEFRCPFQVTGLSNDDVQHAYGVDSFQALHLAFAGVRSVLRKNASVLAAFHENFGLTWGGVPWEAAVPVWVPLRDADEENELEYFVQQLWKKRIAMKRGGAEAGNGEVL